MSIVINNSVMSQRKFASELQPVNNTHGYGSATLSFASCGHQRGHRQSAPARALQPRSRPLRSGPPSECGPPPAGAASTAHCMVPHARSRPALALAACIRGARISRMAGTSNPPSACHLVEKALRLPMSRGGQNQGSQLLLRMRVVPQAVVCNRVNVKDVLPRVLLRAIYPCQ